MKFLIDAQLPKSLSDLLRSKGYDSLHTLELANANLTPDWEIVAISNQQDRVVITKDNDFLESFLLKKEPKKLIIVRTGNIKNSLLLNLFDKSIDKLCVLLNDNSLIELGSDEIIVHA